MPVTFNLIIAGKFPHFKAFETRKEYATCQLNASNFAAVLSTRKLYTAAVTKMVRILRWRKYTETLQ